MSDQEQNGSQEPDKSTDEIPSLGGLHYTADDDSAPAVQAKPAAQKSATKDNQTIKSGAPVVVKTQAQYQALPKGTRYTAPDGTVRIKKD